MSHIHDVAVTLRDFCVKHSEYPVCAGATDAEIEEIKAEFAWLECPLPNGLLEVYRVTLGIVGIGNSRPILNGPIGTSDPGMGFIDFLSSQEYLFRRDGILWLGHGDGGSLHMDRDGVCGVDDVDIFRAYPERSVRMTFEDAFETFAKTTMAEIEILLANGDIELPEEPGMMR